MFPFLNWNYNNPRTESQRIITVVLQFNMCLFSKFWEDPIPMQMVSFACVVSLWVCTAYPKTYRMLMKDKMSIPKITARAAICNSNYEQLLSIIYRRSTALSARFEIWVCCKRPASKLTNQWEDGWSTMRVGGLCCCVWWCRGDALRCTWPACHLQLCERLYESVPVLGVLVVCARCVCSNGIQDRQNCEK